MSINKQILSLILLVSINVYTQHISESVNNAINIILNQHIKDESPGAAIGIVKDEEIIYEKYVGYANMEHMIKVNKQTRFNIASNAKQYTALCILKLSEEGKVSLDDDIRQYLPDYYKSIPDKISIAHLLTHSSGIRDVYDLWALKGQTWWQLFVNNSDALTLLKNQNTLNFKPGTEYLYSNSNYILLTEIIKNITGLDFAEYCKSLFTHLNMQDTSFLTNYMEVIPHKARPYGNWSGWKEYPAITEIHGDGALFTTLKDQLHWERIIQLKQEDYLKRQLVYSSQQPLQNSRIENYGYGVMFGEYKNIDMTYHDGNTGAYNATFLRFPDHNLAIVVMSNNSNVPTNYMAKQVADEILNLKAIKSEYPANPDKIYNNIKETEVVGNYQNEEGTIIKILKKNDSLYRSIYQREPIALIPEKGSLYHYANNNDLKLAFDILDNQVNGFTIYLSSQAPSTFRKLPFFNPDNQYFKGVQGVFYNPETETTIEIQWKGSDTFSVTKNGRERKAQLVYKDLLLMNSYQINIKRNDNAEVEGLSIDNNRIRNVLFDKMK